MAMNLSEMHMSEMYRDNDHGRWSCERYMMCMSWMMDHDHGSSWRMVM